MTLDGFCDHTAFIPGDEIMEYYTNLLRNTGGVLYGRITYQLMEEYWPVLVKEPSGNKLDDEFAVVMENVQKILFSRTLNNAGWTNARLAKQDIAGEALALKQQAGSYLLAGSRSIIIALMNLGLLDEFQICIHPVIAGKGMRLFENINDTIRLKLIKTKVFAGGAVIHYYELEKNTTLV